MGVVELEGAFEETCQVAHSVEFVHKEEVGAIGCWLGGGSLEGGRGGGSGSGGV